VGAVDLSQYLWPDVAQGRQPQAGPLEIDWGNPLTRAASLLFTAANPTLDSASRRTNTVSATSKGTSPYGAAQVFNGAASIITTPLTSSATQRTYWFRVLPNSTADLSRIFDKVSSAQPTTQELLYWQNGAFLFDRNFTTSIAEWSTPAAALSQGVWVDIGVVYDSSSVSNDPLFYINGKAVAVTVVQHGVGSPVVNTAPLTLGNRPTDLGRGFTGPINAGLIADRLFSPTEMAALSANPGQFFATPASISFASAASGGGTTVNPAAGAIALTGYAPTLAQTANQALTAGAGTVALTGYAPAVSRTASAAVTPGVGSIAIAGYAPSVAQSAAGTVQPGVGSIAITGYAPTISQPIAVAPGAGAIALTGYSPSVTQPHAVAAGVGSLVLTGYAPSTAQTTNQSVAPAVGSVALTGYAPSVTQAVASQILIPGVGAMAITGYPPMVAQAAAIEFGAPLISTPTPRNWISSSEPRVWVAANAPRNWIAKRDIT